MSTFIFFHLHLSPSIFFYFATTLISTSKFIFHLHLISSLSIFLFSLFHNSPNNNFHLYHSSWTLTSSFLPLLHNNSVPFFLRLLPFVCFFSPIKIWNLTWILNFHLHFHMFYSLSLSWNRVPAWIFLFCLLSFSWLTQSNLNANPNTTCNFSCIFELHTFTCEPNPIQTVSPWL